VIKKAGQLGLVVTSGNGSECYIAQVQPGGLADKSGVRMGDGLIAVAGVSIQSLVKRLKDSEGILLINFKRRWAWIRRSGCLCYSRS